VHTFKKAQRFSIIKISLLMLFREVIDDYSENQMQSAELMIVKASGTYNYHWALKVATSFSIHKWLPYHSFSPNADD
jgi:hypothetical protein